MKMGKTILKTIVTLVGILLCTMCVAGAAGYVDSVDVNYNTNKVTIDGRGFTDLAGKAVNIIVMKGEAVPGSSDDSVQNQAQTKIEADGTFSYVFKLNSLVTTESYTAYVKVGSNTIEKRVFKYLKRAELIKLHDAIPTNSDDAFAEKLAADATVTDLALLDTVYNKLSLEGKKAAAKAVFASWNDMKETEDKKKIEAIEKLKTALLKASYVQALNEHNDSKDMLQYVAPNGIFIDAEAMEIAGLDSYTRYTKQTTANGQQEVMKHIIPSSGKPYKNNDEFVEQFAFAATLAVIRYPSEAREDSISEILEANAADSGLVLSSYNNKTDSERKKIETALEDVKGSWDKKTVQNDILDMSFEEESKKDVESSGKPSGISGIGSYSQNYVVGGENKPTTPLGFTDIDNVAWAKTAIERLAAKGVVAGRGNGIFAPNDNVTRAEFMLMLVKTLDLKAENAICDFEDVIAGEWYYDAVATGTTLGITSGYGNGYFGTTDLITRQDAAVMINNAVTKSGKTLDAKNDGIDFTDKADISDYATNAVDTLVRAGILSGADGNFMPKANTTRAEAAVMLYNLMTALGLEG